MPPAAASACHSGTCAQLGPRAIDLRWSAAKRGHILTHRSSAAWFATCAASAHSLSLPRTACWRQAGPLYDAEVCLMAPWGEWAGRAVSCPSSTTSEAARGGCTEGLVDDAPRCSRSLEALRPGYPGSPEYASDSTACGIQARSSSVHGLQMLFPKRQHPGAPLEFCNYLMLRPGSHYPKVC